MAAVAVAVAMVAQEETVAVEVEGEQYGLKPIILLWARMA